MPFFASSKNNWKGGKRIIHEEVKKLHEGVLKRAARGTQGWPHYRCRSGWVWRKTKWICVTNYRVLLSSIFANRVEPRLPVDGSRHIRFALASHSHQFKFFSRSPGKNGAWSYDCVRLQKRRHAAENVWIHLPCTFLRPLFCDSFPSSSSSSFVPPRFP